MTKEGVLKLADFGVSDHIADDGNDNITKAPPAYLEIVILWCS